MKENKRPEVSKETYIIELRIGEYETLEIQRTPDDGRITITFNEKRWRTPKEAIILLQRIIKELENF